MCAFLSFLHSFAAVLAFNKFSNSVISQVLMKK